MMVITRGWSLLLCHFKGFLIVNNEYYTEGKQNEGIYYFIRYIYNTINDVLFDEIFSPNCRV